MLIVEVLLMLLLGFGGGEGMACSPVAHSEASEVSEQKPRETEVPTTWGEIKAKYGIG